MGVEGKQEMNTVFCYDSMNRLTMENRREGGEKYAYDLGGNRLRKQRYHYALTADGDMDSVIDEEESYCYNERNELTQRRNLLSVTEYIYDENGSLLKEKEGEKETGYRYDLLNRQKHVQLPDGRVQENLYDGEGLRAGLTENGKSTTFLFYNGEILAECNGDSMPIRRHLRGFGLSRVEDISTGTSHAYHQDEQGSTAYVTGSTGETENLYSYDGFGNILESGEDITNRILYTGQQYDQETGQYYLRARYYNPVIGRFTQEDTYRGDGLNLYAYCDNNPVMYYDPSGHDCDDNAQKKTDKTPSEEADVVTLYHGTSTEGAESIRNNGVDLEHATRDMDFGRGFYTTDDIGQAKDWAARHGADGGAIVEFNIPKSEFDSLNNKVFTSADVEWEEFVINSRNGMSNNYDTISGPMLANPKGALKGAPPKSSGHQTAFNTQKAVDLLNKYMKRG